MQGKPFESELGFLADTCQGDPLVQTAVLSFPEGNALKVCLLCMLCPVHAVLLCGAAVDIITMPCCPLKGARPRGTTPLHAVLYSCSALRMLCLCCTLLMQCFGFAVLCCALLILLLCLCFCTAAVMLCCPSQFDMPPLQTCFACYVDPTTVLLCSAATLGQDHLLAQARCA